MAISEGGSSYGNNAQGIFVQAVCLSVSEDCEGGSITRGDIRRDECICVLYSATSG